MEAEEMVIQWTRRPQSPQDTFSFERFLKQIIIHEIVWELIGKNGVCVCCVIFLPAFTCILSHRNVQFVGTAGYLYDGQLGIWRGMIAVKDI